MKRYYRIGIIGLLIALLAMVIMPVLPALAADLPDSPPSIVTKKCYRNLLETADFLIVWEANIPYASLPDDPVTDTFIWEFIDTDGSTVLGSTVGWAYQGSGYNYQSFSMYFDAAAGLSWDPGTPYTLRLQGNPLAFDTPPTYNYTITSSEYSSFTATVDVQDEITIDVLLIAADLDIQWGLATSLVLNDETGQTLSAFGQAYFRGAIYGLQTLAPGLFPLALTTIDITDRTWTDSYVSSLENQYSGTWVDTAKQGGAALFGTSFDMLSIILLLIGIIALFVGNTMLTNDHWNAAIDVAFFLIVTAKLSFYGLGYLGLIVALCVIYLGMRLFKFPH